MIYLNFSIDSHALRLFSISTEQPDAVDPDCLRNAVNSFTYQDPVNLPPMAPARQLSSEPHSFSRVFTGARCQAGAGGAELVCPGQSGRAKAL